MNPSPRVLAAIAAALVPMAATGAGLPTAPYLPLTLATQAAQTALEDCAGRQHAVTVAVVARSGETKVLLKADGSGPHSGGSSTGKAFTSASMGRESAALAEFIGANPQNDGLRDMDARLVIQAGGLPIRIGGALVGGIGVGGAPSGAIDAECARAGLDAIGAD